jgi:hypothetical protein
MRRNVKGKEWRSWPKKNPQNERIYVCGTNVASRTNIITPVLAATSTKHKGVGLSALFNYNYSTDESNRLLDTHKHIHTHLHTHIHNS